MKKNTIFTLIITLALLVSNLSAVFADNGSGETPELKDAQPAAQNTKSSEALAQEEVELFQENDNTDKFDFSGAQAPEGWVLGGDAEMTGDGKTDSEGDGWLRLTGTDPFALGYAVYDKALESANGLAFNFDYTSWGGRGADGITFFLMDGETTMEEFNPGGVGGSLGYAPRVSSDYPGKGLSNAVVGIGFDAFGNFSASGEGRNGGDGREQDSVAVRGASDEGKGYEFIAGTDTFAAGIDIAKMKVRPDQSGKDYRNVSIMFMPVEQQFSLTLSLQFGADSEPELLFKDLLIPGITPATVKFGFTASSGSYTNNHEIRNLIIDKAVINDIIQQIEDEEVIDNPIDEVEEPISDEKAKKTVSMPVTAVVTGDTLTIIPVTGSELNPLSCYAQTMLDIKNEAFAILPALCGQEASLVLEALGTIPFALPEGYTFLNASTLTIVDGATFDAYAANSAELEVGFYLEAGQDTANLVILVWQGGQWVEQQVVIADGVISTIVTEGALFVLASK